MITVENTEMKLAGSQHVYSICYIIPFSNLVLNVVVNDLMKFLPSFTYVGASTL